MTNRAELRSWFNNPASGSGVYHRNFNLLCQALIWRIADAFGSPVNPTTYGSATAAREASGALSTVAAAAPPGALHYWAGGNIGAAGHVGLDLQGGGTDVLMATGRAVAGKTDWGYDVIEASVASYTATGAGYAGWSTHQGTTVIPVTPDNVLTPTQRRSKTAGKVNRRVGPGTLYPEVTPESDLAANTVGNFKASAHGPASKGQPAGNDLWYQGISGDWFWSGGFTEVSAHDLPDLTAQFADVVAPPPVTTPPVTTPVDTPPNVDPPTVDPPVSDPPATDPPADDPPATDPPVTDPPADDPPADDPPVTEPPAPTQASKGGIFAAIAVVVSLIVGVVLAIWPW